MSARTRNAQGFTLVEILIVVVILGILAAIVIPQFTNASETAKASNLTSQLQSIRSQLELYQVQHNGSYPDLSANWNRFTMYTDIAGTTNATKTAVFAYGPYLQQSPINPFTASSTTAAAAGATVGWVYSSTTGVIKASITAAKASTLNLSTDNDVATY